MSNDIGSTIANFSLPELKSTESDRIKTATISGKQFRFVRKTARQRTAMLFKATPLTSLIGELFSSIKEAYSESGSLELGSMSEKQKLDLGTKIAAGLADSLSKVD